MSPILSVQDLEVTFRVGPMLGRQDILGVAGVSFDVRPGETFALVGESGSGKTTLARAINGLQAISAGSVTYEGQRIDTLDRRAMTPIRRRMAMMFQDPVGSLSPRMKVGDLVAEPFRIHGRGGVDLREETDRLLSLVGLPADFAEHFPHQLSGGQPRRVGVARAVALNPALIIADEPTTGLDVSVQGEVLNLRERLGLAMIITHNLHAVHHVADPMAVMYLGRFVETGDSDGVVLDQYADIETQDGVDVIAWIAAQDWCDGNVGMFGKSWGAYNSFQIAARRPPAPKAIAPVMGCDDRWRENIHFYGGCLAGHNFWWGSIMQLLNAMPPDPAIVGADRWRDMWRQRLDSMTYWPAQWLEHQTHDEMWRRGSIRENYDDVQVPVYFFGGWADLFRDTPFRIAQHLKGPVTVLMGPWAHLYPHEGVPGPKVDFLAEVIRFSDHWLKGIDTGLMDEPPLRFYLQDSVRPSGTQTQRPGTWVEETAWPSANTRTEKLWLNNGALAAASEPGKAMSICSPQTFGAAGGDMCSFAIPGDMPGDCRIDTGGAFCFRAAPASEPLDILGQPTVHLSVKADRSQGIAAALVIDEAPDGAQTLITRGFANLTHRRPDTDPDPVVPGEEMQITVPLHGIGHRLAARHRLVVQIASTYWPILWPAPGPGPKPAITQTRKVSMDRSLHTDLTIRLHTARFFLDGGVFGPVGTMRLDETGIEMCDISDRRYCIHPDDPLTARATMDQDSHFLRDDWDVRIKTKAVMTATVSDFHLKASVTCWDGDDEFYHVDWDHTIPRNGM